MRNNTRPRPLSLPSWSFLALWALLLCLAASPAMAEETAINLLGYGIYDVQLTPGTDAEQLTDQTMDSVTEMRLLAQTNTIPKELGTIFGCHYQFTGIPEGQERTLTFALHHPHMVNDQGEVVPDSSFEQTVSAGATFHDLFVFENPWEMVDGDYVFTIFEGNRQISIMTFHVY